MKMAVPAVEVGQVWISNDPREQGDKERHLRVVEMLPNGAIVEVVVHPNRKVVGRRSAILLRRFRPTQTGYRLLSPALTPTDVGKE